MNLEYLLHTTHTGVQVLLYLYLFFIGMCLGSFFMVVGFRVPRQETLLGRSHCEACQTQIKAWQLIPVFSYCLLKGRCQTCQTKIGKAYPLFEILSGLVFVLTAYMTAFSKETIVGFTLISLLLIISVTDMVSRKIPNKVLLPFGILALMERLFFTNPNAWWYPFAGFGIGFGLLFLLGLVSKGGMGGGDIKLYGVIGIFIGPIEVLISLVLASTIAVIFYIILFALGGKKKDKYIPFGPFIALATLAVYLFFPGVFSSLIGS